MNLYFIHEGEVALIMTHNRLFSEIPDTDDDSVLVYVEDECHALELAKRYDAGEIQTDNVRLWYGKTVAALR